MHCHAPSEGSDPLPCYPYNWRERVREREGERGGERSGGIRSHFPQRDITILSSIHFFRWLYMQHMPTKVPEQECRGCSFSRGAPIFLYQSLSLSISLTIVLPITTLLINRDKKLPYFFVQHTRSLLCCSSFVLCLFGPTQPS